MNASSANQFKLIGHSSPLGRYPSIVIPIGMLDGDWVAVYSTEKLPSPISISPKEDFVRHIPRVAKSLRNFDYRTQRLFAYYSIDVGAYRVSEEKAFFAKKLDDPRFNNENPFSRLSFAKLTGEDHLIRIEMQRCYDYLCDEYPDLMDNWWMSERYSIEQIDGCGLEAPKVSSLDDLGRYIRLNIEERLDSVANEIKNWLHRADHPKCNANNLYNILFDLAKADGGMLDYLCDVIANCTGVSPPKKRAIGRQRALISSIKNRANISVEDIVRSLPEQSLV